MIEIPDAERPGSTADENGLGRTEPASAVPEENRHVVRVEVRDGNIHVPIAVEICNLNGSRNRTRIELLPRPKRTIAIPQEDRDRTGKVAGIGNREVPSSITVEVT